MLQDKNDIENKLRQLENQQLPDLSQMDGHWESMKAAMQPVLVAGVNERNKWLLLTGLLALIGTVILLINKNDTIKKNEPAEKKTYPVAVKEPDFKMSDSAASSAMPVNYVAVSKMPVIPAPIKDVKNKLSHNETVKSVINLPVQLSPSDSTLKAVNPDAQKILNDLLASLAKKAEEFIIDNSRDTVLFATEGSSLFIPANSLCGSHNVKISLREFYKTSDIVMNKLSTTSNGEQLVTGGMVHISATVNDKPVNVFPGKSIKWYLPDTTKQMEQMQLFNGEQKQNTVNWISTDQWFSRPYSTILTEVRVLDLSNEPFRVIKKRKGDIGVFVMSHESKLSKEELQSVLKEKYGYYKVRIKKWRFNITDVFLKRSLNRAKNGFRSLGDSAWLKKEKADQYNLPSTQTRTTQFSGWRNLWGGSVLNMGHRITKGKMTKSIDTLANHYSDTMANNEQPDEFQEGLDKIREKYSVDIRTLGWINCDRFYNDKREKVDYYVNLQDSAINYYTMIVFNKFRSIMAGYVTGNNVYFSNVPIGEPVKIISIGIDKRGDAVLAMKETKISKETFAGLQFESASASTIKSTLRKEDN